MVRELRIQTTDQKIGSVSEAEPHFRGAASEQFADARRRVGDDEAARVLIANGWSNGYIYLSEPTP